MFQLSSNPRVGISFRLILQVYKEDGPVPDEFHGHQSTFARLERPEADFLGFKLTL